MSGITCEKCGSITAWHDNYEKPEKCGNCGADLARQRGYVLLKNLVMPFTGIQKCENCTQAIHEFDGDYGTIDCGWYCGLHENFHEKRGYPKNFPFLQAPGCFIPEFFLTSFSDILPDDFCGEPQDDDIYQAACKEYLKFYYNRA